MSCQHRFSGVCAPCREREARARVLRDEQHRGWFEQTGHCGYCGGPGGFCTCTDADPCGCSGLHELGSALLPGALETFAPERVHVEQDALFGDPA